MTADDRERTFQRILTLRGVIYRKRHIFRSTTAERLINMSFDELLQLSANSAIAEPLVY